MTHHVPSSYTGRNPVLAAVLLTCCAIAMSACTMPMMAVPNALKGRSDFHPVQQTRIDESVAFGGWRTLDVDRSWTTRIGKGIAFGGVGKAHETADQPYTFTLAGGPQRWLGECVTRRRMDTVKVGPVTLREGTTRIRCVAAQEKGKDRFEIGAMMGGTGTVGAVRVGEHWLTLSTSHRLANGARLGRAVGYVMGVQGQTIAAVGLTNQRGVWIRKGMSHALQARVAVTLAAILLYKEISDTSAASR